VKLGGLVPARNHRPLLLVLCVLSLLRGGASAGANDRFCATGGPESVLRCLSQAYADRDSDAYEILLAPDFQEVPPDSAFDEPRLPLEEQPWGISGKERELERFRRSLSDGHYNWQVTFLDEYDLSPGRERDTWIIENATVVEELTPIDRAFIPSGTQVRTTGQRLLVRRVVEPELHFEIVQWARAGTTSARGVDLQPLESSAAPRPPAPLNERVLRGPGYAFKLRAPATSKILKTSGNPKRPVVRATKDPAFGWDPLVERRFGEIALCGGAYLSVDRRSSAFTTTKVAIVEALAEYERVTPGLRVMNADSLVTADGRKVPAIRLEDATGEKFEAVAFILEDSVVVRIGCMGRRRFNWCTGNTEGEFREAFEKLRPIVAGYSILLQER
jgi:hypothetical protein